VSATVTPTSNTPKTTPTTYATNPGRRHFWLRRLHSLAGILFGGYIVVHLTVNATAISPRAFQQNVDKIHGLEPMLPLIEVLTIFAPLLLHMIYGIYISFAGVKFNTTKYNYGGNLRYTLQRWTAVILLLFLVLHIGTLHKWGFAALHSFTHVEFFKNYGDLFQPHNQAYQSTVGGIRHLINHENPWHPGNVAVMGFYLLGVWSAAFHFANGLWTSAIAWGLTVTASAQKRWGHFCLGLGAMLLVVGTVAWAAFTIHPNAAGDLGRWDEVTRTQSHDSPVHEQSEGIVKDKAIEKLTAPATQP